MKLNLKTVLAASMTAFMLAGCSASAPASEPAESAPETFTVGFDAEFPPYGYKEGNEYVGFDLDLAQAVADANGWELVKQPIDWDSKDMELSSGAIDCIWNGFTINGREDGYTWSTPYIDNSQVVVVKADSGIDSLADLAGKVMDTQADSSALAALQGDDATEAGKAVADSLATLTQVPDYNTAFMDLESGACDAIAVDQGVAQYQLANRGDAYKILDEEISSEQYGIGFKKGNTELRDKVEATLTQLQKDGKLDQILKDWASKEDGAYSFLETSWVYGKE